MGGTMPRWLTARFGWHAAEIGGAFQSERSIIDRAANLKQEISPSSGPAHLLRFAHSPIEDEICGPFCNRSSDTETGTVSLGVVDEPTTLASETSSSACHSLREAGLLVCWPRSSL
jgi:hypothetical protein